MSQSLLRKHLSIQGLLHVIGQEFNQIEDPSLCSSPRNISLKDSLMSAMAIFGMKYPSLLQFDNDKETIQSNLRQCGPKASA